MSALRAVRLLGGADACSVRVVDADTGEEVRNVVKIELLVMAGSGALINITTACRVAEIELVASVVDAPLIDAPDDGPAVEVAEALSDGDQQLLVEAIEQNAAPAPRTTLAPGTPWPFPRMQVAGGAND
jgi:hypothetical protein